MSAKTETGGPAFPCHADIIPSKDRDYAGMALRDYFAAAALTGIIAKGEDEMYPGLRASEAYALADAMLKGREFAAPARPVDQVNAKLLEALKDALGFLEAVCFNTPNPKKRKDYADAASRCRAAISKATGEPQ